MNVDEIVQGDTLRIPDNIETGSIIIPGELNHLISYDNNYKSHRFFVFYKNEGMLYSEGTFSKREVIFVGLVNLNKKLPPLHLKINKDSNNIRFIKCRGLLIEKTKART